MSEPSSGPGSRAADEFFDAAVRLLTQVRDTQRAAIAEAAGLLADAVAGGGRIWAYGAGHSALPAQDLVYRAGGLALVNLLAVPGAAVDVRPAVLGSALETVEGLAGVVLASSGLRDGDVLLVVSLSGRNTLPVELARGARDRGVKVIGVTSVAYAHETTPRNASGTFLKDHCDVVLDSRIPVGDAELEAPGVAAPFGPASTVVTSALMQAVGASAVAELARRGLEPPVLRSGNVDGGLEWNAKVFERYGERILYRQ